MRLIAFEFGFVEADLLEDCVRVRVREVFLEPLLRLGDLEIFLQHFVIKIPIILIKSTHHFLLILTKLIRDIIRILIPPLKFPFANKLFY